MIYSRIVVSAIVVGCSAVATGEAGAQTRSEIQEMDRNVDGVVTREEWQGERSAFRQHDVNRDGVLSGTEVWDARGARGRARARANRTTDDWAAAEFGTLDRDRDNRVTAEEWPWDRRSFTRADGNRDNVISRAEFLNDDGWAGRQFRRFRDYDVNNDGAIARGEWHESHLAFLQLDRNRDERVSRDEFRGVAATSGAAQLSGAYRAGYERGQVEGRAAGREDRDRHGTWDLEGQRELESADSGYNAQFGPRAEYQAGYREGFRAAYREGWERR